MTEETLSIEQLEDLTRHFDRLHMKTLAATGRENAEYRREYEHYRDRWYAARNKQDQGAQ